MDKVGKPLVVATIPVGSETDYERCVGYVHGMAYSLEMQIDNEWHVDLVLLTPARQLWVVTKNTEMTTDSPAIVSGGVMDVGLKEGKPELDVIRDERNNWLLLGAPRSQDTQEVICVKRDAALNAGCRVIVCFSELEGGQLARRLEGVKGKDMERVVAAYTGAKQNAQAVAEHARAVLGDGFGVEGGARLIVLSNPTADEALALAGVAGVAGVLLLSEDPYAAPGVLEVLRAMDETFPPSRGTGV